MLGEHHTNCKKLYGCKSERSLQLLVSFILLATHHLMLSNGLSAQRLSNNEQTLFQTCSFTEYLWQLEPEKMRISYGIWVDTPNWLTALTNSCQQPFQSSLNHCGPKYSHLGPQRSPQHDLQSMPL
eukprot:4858381-Amphidinium_carterae.1